MTIERLSPIMTKTRLWRVFVYLLSMILLCSFVEISLYLLAVFISDVCRTHCVCCGLCDISVRDSFSLPCFFHSYTKCQKVLWCPLLERRMHHRFHIAIGATNINLQSIRYLKCVGCSHDISLVSG
jgi:hypothetical protein